MASWNWPPDFPDDCPPEDAVPANGVYYRIVKTNTPQSSDFVSIRHKDPDRADLAIANGLETPCTTIGISVFEEKDEAVRRARKYRRLGSMLARVTLTPDTGKILHTPRPRGGGSHHTWWPVHGLDPVSVSQIEMRVPTGRR